MARAEQFKRLLLLSTLLLAAFAGLGYRLVDLQVVRHEHLAERGRNNVERTFVREPRRGDIRDVRGNQLATSVFVKTICADPTLISNATDRAVIARVVAPRLDLSEAEAIHLLTPRPYLAEGVLKTNRYVVLKRKVSFEKWDEVRSGLRDVRLPGEEFATNRVTKAYYRNVRNAIYADKSDDQVRIYPNGALAAHVLGYVGQSTNQTRLGGVLGLGGFAGIEKRFNSSLAGSPGWLSTETDKRRNELVWARDQDVQARPGQNVYLTIDSGVQHIVETTLADAWKKHTPISVSCVVVRPKTGEILAMATLPNYNPNNLHGVPQDSMRNRLICDTAEPGSTFKIVVVSSGLNDGLITLNDRFDCEHGHFSFAGKVLHDHEAYGVLSIEDIIAKSSNIGSAKVGIKMGKDRLYRHIRDFGFDTRTGIALPGEVDGLVHKPDKWALVDISRIPMGHTMTCTPLQMVMAMCAVANKGTLMRPMIVDRIEDAEGNATKYYPQTVRRVVTESSARDMVTALKKVVSKDGTAAQAQMENYTVAGKTGTAQKVVNGQYVKGKYFSSFIGFFPADDPELCISVVFDEPKNGYYGGQTAAPFFKRIAEQSAGYLKIKPDRTLEGTPLTSEPKAITAKQD